MNRADIQVGARPCMTDDRDLVTQAGLFTASSNDSIGCLDCIPVIR